MEYICQLTVQKSQLKLPQQVAIDHLYQIVSILIKEIEKKTKHIACKSGLKCYKQLLIKFAQEKIIFSKSSGEVQQSYVITVQEVPYQQIPRPNAIIVINSPAAVEELAEGLGSNTTNNIIIITHLMQCHVTD